MQAEYRDLDVLVEIQRIDLEILQKKKARGALPQRIEVVKVRKKRDGIAPKLDQVIELQTAKESEITRVEDEDSHLAERQERTQADIEAFASDFRSVESYSRDLDGIVKRRVTLEENLAALKAELDKILAVRKQVEDALALCDKQEETLRAAYKQEDDVLVDQVRTLLAEREQLAQKVPADLLKLYDKTAKKTGGVALGKLEGDTCGVCRTTLEGGRLINVRSQAPLSQCPNCGRLLIIQDEDEA